MFTCTGDEGSFGCPWFGGVGVGGDSLVVVMAAAGGGNKESGPLALGEREVPLLASDCRSRPNRADLTG